MLRKNHLELETEPKSAIKEWLWKKISEKHSFAELSPGSLANLSEANTWLKENSLVVYVNHTSTNDAAVAVALVLAHLPQAQRFLAPAGMKHYDLHRDFKNGILLRSLKLLKIHAIPVVQADDLDSYPPKKREKMLAQLKATTTKLLNQPGSVYGITPEGTRSRKTKALLRAKSGLGKIEKYTDKPIKLLPVSITYKTQSKHPEVVVGKPMTTNEVLQILNITHLPDDENERAQLISDAHMLRLAAQMKPELRGVYSDSTTITHPNLGT